MYQLLSDQKISNFTFAMLIFRWGICMQPNAPRPLQRPATAEAMQAADDFVQSTLDKLMDVLEAIMDEDDYRREEILDIDDY